MRHLHNFGKTNSVTPYQISPFYLLTVKPDTNPALVNKLPAWIKGEIRMFADDTKVWHMMRTSSDAITPQEDLDSLSMWSSIWQLKFNADKCKVMHTGHTYGNEYFMTEGSMRIKLNHVLEERF